MPNPETRTQVCNISGGGPGGVPAAAGWLDIRRGRCLPLHRLLVNVFLFTNITGKLPVNMFPCSTIPCKLLVNITLLVALYRTARWSFEEGAAFLCTGALRY